MSDIGNDAIWSPIDANNNVTLGPGFPENMPRKDVNDSMRGVMGAVKRFFLAAGAKFTSTNSGNAYSVAYTVAPDSYYDGQSFTFIPNTTNTGASTLNAGVSAKAIKKVDFSGSIVDLSAGEIVANRPTTVYYKSASNAFILPGDFPSIIARVAVNFDGTTVNSIAVTYVLAGATNTTLTITEANHGHLVGHVINFNGTSGGLNARNFLLTLTAVTTNTYTGTYTGAGSGSPASGNGQSRYMPLNGGSSDNKNVHSVCINPGIDGDYVINYSVTAPTISGQHVYGSALDSVLNTNGISVNPLAIASNTSWRIGYSNSGTGGYSSSGMRAVILW